MRQDRTLRNITVDREGKRCYAIKNHRNASAREKARNRTERGKTERGSLKIRSLTPVPDPIKRV